MMENNIFRVMMLVGGVMVTAVILSAVFVLRTIPLGDGSAASIQNGHAMYEAVMREELPDDAEKLTLYEAARFSVKGKVRGNVRHY